MNQAILSILSQKKSSHGNLRIRKFPVVRKYLRIRNFPVVRKKSYGSVSEAGEFGHNIMIRLCVYVQNSANSKQLRIICKNTVYHLHYHFFCPCFCCRFFPSFFLLEEICHILKSTFTYVAKMTNIFDIVFLTMRYYGEI